MASSTTSVTDTYQWRSGEGHLHSARSGSHIFGSPQRQHRDGVFRRDAGLASVAVDHQTRCVDSLEIQCAQRHTCDTIRQDPTAKILDRDPVIGKTSSLSPPRIQCQSASSATTSAGVMRSRTVRRLHNPARCLPEAPQAMLSTPWAPHLNLPHRPRLQRPTYEELMIEAGMLPRFIETPTTKAKPKPKPAEKFVRCRVMPSDPQHVSARRCPENSVSWDLQLPLLHVPQTHGCMFRSHKDRTYTSIITRRARRQHSGNVRGQRS